jgi:hypothetical protein
MTRTRWHDVDAAIRDCLEHVETIRAVDPERLAAQVSWDKPNPRRTPTVRKTGHEGSLPRRDPLAAVARGRMRALLEELKADQPLMAACAVAAAQGWTRRLERDLGRRHGSLGQLADEGRRRLRLRMVVLGLLEAA